MSLTYSQLPETAFQSIGINSGVLMTRFDIATGAVNRADILGATTGDVNFAATPTFSDLGAGLNNCPRGTKELMRLESWSVRLSGTLATCDTPAARRLMGLADADGQRLAPRSALDLLRDFPELWLVFDYSDVNTGATPGRFAIRMRNVLSTGGFQVRTANAAMALWPFEFSAHYSLDDPDAVPFEVYIVRGEAEA